MDIDVEQALALLETEYLQATRRDRVEALTGLVLLWRGSWAGTDAEADSAVVTAERIVDSVSAAVERRFGS